jgi:hypothetical protein
MLQGVLCGKTDWCLAVVAYKSDETCKLREEDFRHVKIYEVHNASLVRRIVTALSSSVKIEGEMFH